MRAEIVNFLSNAAIFSSLLLIPLFADELGASASEIGIIVASYSAATFVASYLFGRLADVHGRRLILRVGLLLSAVACVVQYLSYDTLSLLFTRILLGFCSGIFPAALLAYAYESKRRMNRFLAYGSGGWGLGTIGAGILATYFTIKEPFLFSGLLFFIALPIAFKMPFKKDVSMSVPLFPVKIIRKNLAVYLTMLVRHSGACAIWVTFPLFVRDLGGTGGDLFFWIGVLYALNSTTQFIVLGRLRKPSSVLLPVGLVLSAATFLLFTICENIWQLMPTQILLACAWALVYLGSVKFIMVRNRERATATGVLNSTFQISSIIGALMGGAIVHMTGSYLAPMYLAAGMAMFSLLIYFGLRNSTFVRAGAHV
jgi:DHA1 family quinolone resistance protein-like MFS transporter